jgi:hypothetical protein
MAEHKFACLPVKINGAGREKLILIARFTKQKIPFSARNLIKSTRQ